MPQYTYKPLYNLEYMIGTLGNIEINECLHCYDT